MQSDFFLRVEKNSRSIHNNKLNRFFNLIFNSEIVTPTFHEKAMYLANAAAGTELTIVKQKDSSKGKRPDNLEVTDIKIVELKSMKTIYKKILERKMQ